MRIVDVNEIYSPTGGGVRTYIDRKIGIMADLGHELIVLACGKEERIEDRPGGGRIHYVKSPPIPFDKNYGLFWDRDAITGLLDHYDPDVVENCSPWKPAWFVGDWQGRALKSYFMHNDNMAAYAQRWFEGVASAERVERAFAWYTRYMARFLDKYDCVVTNGPALQKRLTARGLRIDAAFPLGIERQHFSPRFRDERLRRALLAPRADMAMPSPIPPGPRRSSGTSANTARAVRTRYFAVARPAKVTRLSIPSAPIAETPTK